ncbi:hypothetical protein [Embleya scabrispora]|uniref:hypothetical protein n=1 Tax=Embleya scabrispora TaxID=159449 RepID=UPI0003A9E88F|nr:hypothetical protein [Embleya scabrispora]MYS85332.1 hypothetical protein [Streptomyces sp. SID5474]
MRFRARFAAAVIPLLVVTAACGGSEDEKDDAKAPGVGGAADATIGASGGGSVSSGDISADTRGHTLVVPESVDAYTKSGPGTTPGEKEGEGLGVANARAVSGVYNAPGTDPGNPAKIGGTRLTFNGFSGEIADPAEALDKYLADVGNKGLKGTGKAQGMEIRPVASARTVKPAGFEGALMKCQDMKVTHSRDDGTPKNGADFRFPVCAWADYSTLGGANVVVLAEMTIGGNGVPQDEVAALTARLYTTARHKA